MYQVGDIVLYGSEGVCKISGIEEKKIMDRKVNCYILQPVNDKHSVFFIPTDSGAAQKKLRHIAGAKELDAIFHSAEPVVWIESDRARREAYRTAIGYADRAALASLIKAVCMQRAHLALTGKKLHKIDEYFLSEAEKLLYGELSTVFEIEKEEVVPYILGECSLKAL